MPAPSWPGELVARPCAEPARAFHHVALVAARNDAISPVSRARVAYHERWLAHLRGPADPRPRPRLSCVVAVLDRPRLAAEAVASALDQTWGPCEVIVVDDGSRDPAALRAALAPFAHGVTLVRQDNQGPSAARNLGLSLARGELVHFLDSDNRLHRDAAARWMAAFAAVPDAGVCYSPTEIADPDGGPSRLQFAPTGEAGCATRDLLAATAAGYPFLVGGAALPRWVALRAGGFDPALRRSEDARFWFVLAMQGVKAIGLRRPLHARGRPADRLCADRDAMVRASALVWLVNMTDLLATPWAWPHAGALLDQLFWSPGWGAVEHNPDADLEIRRAALLSTIERLGERARRGGRSHQRMLELCESTSRRWERKYGSDPARGLFLGRWRAAIRVALPRTEEAVARDRGV